MTASTWHLDADLAHRYAAGTVGTVLASSVEQHLTACGDCRALLRPHVDPARLRAGWSEVLERVERPEPTPFERLLFSLGMQDATARLVAATPALRGAWVASVTLVLALAVVAAYTSTNGVAVYLTLAPLLPMAGVASVYGRGADPAYEVVAATPYSSVRLLALRTALVVAVTLVPATAAGLLLPASPVLAVAWLLPALALATGTVVLGTWFGPQSAAAGLGAVWLSLSLGVLLERREPLATVSGPVLTASALAVLAAAAYLIAHRRDLSELFRRLS